jgi:hypothetical protein
VTGITITFEPNELPARVGDCNREADAKLAIGLARIGVRGQAIARGLAPVHSGAYQRSIRGRVLRRPPAVEVKSSSRLAHVIQGGRGPGKAPPPKAVARKFGLSMRRGSMTSHSAYLIARSIGRHGAPGHDVLAPTLRALEPLVREVAHDIASSIGRIGDRTAL